MTRNEVIGLIQTTMEGHSNDPEANWGDGYECSERILEALERSFLRVYEPETGELFEEIT